MVESYRVKSKLATAIGGICTIISVLGVNQLEALFPEYGKFIPAIVALATWYVSQSTENTRVERAEQIVHEEYRNAGDDVDEPEQVVVNLTLDGEDVISDSSEPIHQIDNNDDDLLYDESLEEDESSDDVEEEE